MAAGSTVQILEEDDGSGWVKVADEFGGKGLVPAAYVEVVQAPASVPSRAPPVPIASTRPRTGGQYGGFVLREMENGSSLTYLQSAASTRIKRAALTN